MLKELYRLESVADLHSIGGGYTTENFLFTDTEHSFFLKRYNTTNTQRIHDITVAYDRFAQGGIPVIEPIKNIQSEASFFLDDAWWGVFPFVEGISKPSHELTVQDVQELGSMLARIHRVGQTCPRQDIQAISLWNKEIFTSERRLLEYTYAHLPNTQEVDRMALENIRLQDQFLSEHASFIKGLRPINDSLIHGDFTHSNIFFHPDGQIKATYDLDKACIAPRSYELARSTLIICFDHAWDETSFVLADAFLRSYLKEEPMSKDAFQLGLHTYIANFMHMTWLEKKVLLYRSARHEKLLRSSHVRVKHLAEEFLTLPDRLYPSL